MLDNANSRHVAMFTKDVPIAATDGPQVIGSDDRRTPRGHDVDGLVRVRTAPLGVRVPKLLGPDAFDRNLEVTVTECFDGVAHGH